jgi:glycosyltransferase involved in cell wall biosynthesis
MITPRVAIVTITIPERKDFLEQCKKYVAEQTYKNIIHIEVKGPEVKGTKRNQGAEMAIAAGADIIVTADDDDILLPTSVEKRVNALLGGAELCGTSLYHGYDMRGGYGVLLQETKGPQDATLAYWTRMWKEHQFEPNRKMSEGAIWAKYFGPRILDLHDLEIFIYLVHDHNYTGRGIPLYRKFRTDTTKAVHKLMGNHLQWYLDRQTIPYCIEPRAGY